MTQALQFYPVLWIRIRIGSVFRSFQDPDPMYLDPQHWFYQFRFWLWKSLDPVLYSDCRLDPVMYSDCRLDQDYCSYFTMDLVLYSDCRLDPVLYSDCRLDPVLYTVDCRLDPVLYSDCRLDPVMYSDCRLDQDYCSYFTMDLEHWYRYRYGSKTLVQRPVLQCRSRHLD